MVTVETPGQRLSRQFWTLCLVILLIAALDAIWQPLAVAVVLIGIACWALPRLLRALARPPARR